MVNEFCGFKHGVIGTDKMPADSTLNNMKKADLIKLLHTAQHNYETLMWFYNNAVKANMAQLNNNGWISVEDALPEDGTEVLVYMTDYDEISVAWYNEVQKLFYSNDFPVDMSKYIIAWQPLPERPAPKKMETEHNEQIRKG